MEINANSKLAEAAGVFEILPAEKQDAIIEMLKHLLSEREKYPAQPQTTARKD